MPPFVLKQVVDDIARMYAFAGLKNNTEAISRALVNMPKFWFQELTGRKSAAVKALEARGLVGTYDFTETGNVKSIMTESGLGKRGFTEKLVHWMEAGAKASDLAVRQSIYEQVLKETGSTAEAENRAREIINFSRRGNARMMDYMIRVVPFFNAFARGTDKLLVAGQRMRRLPGRFEPGFDEGIEAGEDVEFSYRASRVGVVPRYAPDAVVHYRYRTTLGGLWRQGRAYGRVRAVLGRRLAADGLAGSRTK